MSTGRSVRNPDSTVRHEQQTVSPTTVRPRMLKCIVGPLYEIVDPTISGVPNADAVVATPAFLIGDTVADGLVQPTSGARNVRIQTASGVTDYALPVSTDPSQPQYSLQLALDYIAEAVPELRGAVADNRAILETLATGSGAFLRLLPTTNDAYTILGIKEFENVTLRGVTRYQNGRVDARFTALPDPRGNLSELDIDEDSVTAWLSRSGSLIELPRDAAVLRHRYQLSATTRQLPYVDNETLATFPQALFPHELRPKDDGDTDGQTPDLYARGTNAALFVSGADAQTDYLVLEAWGDQLASDPGPYHGALGNGHSLLFRPSEHATVGTLVTVAGTAITAYPHVRIKVRRVGAYADLSLLVGQTITESGGPVWSAVVAAATLATDGTTPPGSNDYWLELYGLALGVGGDASIPRFKNIVAAQNATLLAVAVTVQAGTGIITTLGQLKTALESSAANVVRVASYGDTTEEVYVGDDYFDLTINDPSEVKIGDTLIESAGATWSGYVVATDAGGPTVLLDPTSTAIPAPADTAYRQGSDTNILYTIAGGGSVYRMLQVRYFAGGRDPVNFLATPGAAILRNLFPVSASADHEVAGLVRVENLSASLPARGLAIFGTSGAQGRVLDSGSLHLMVGFNPAGEVMWPQDGETVTVTPEEGGTAVTARVVEFHTVLTTKAVGSTLIQAGDTLFMNNGADSEARSYVLETNDDPAGHAIPGDVIMENEAGGSLWTGLVSGPITGGPAPWFIPVRLAAGSALPIMGQGFGKAGDSNYFSIDGAVVAPDVAEWSFDVVRATRIDDPVNPAAREYQLVVKNLTRTLASTLFDRGLAGRAGGYYLTDASLAPTACGQDIAADAEVLTHALKTIPTAGTNFYLSISGGAEAQVALDGDEVPADVALAINDAVSDDADLFARILSNFLVLDASQLPNANPNTWRNNAGGQENTIRLSGEGLPYVFGSGFQPTSRERAVRAVHRACDTDYDFTAVAAFGTSFLPQIGDEVYDGTTLIGKLAAIQTLEYGGQSFAGARLVLDREVSASHADYTSWYIYATGLTEATEPDDYNTGVPATERPYPQFAVFTAGQRLLVLHDVMRLGDGVPAAGLNSSIYIAYRGLRLDVSPQAADPALIECGDVTTLLADYGPVRPENPLAWGLYLAMQEGPGRIIAAVGLDEATTELPYGTPAAHARAIAFLARERRVYSRHILGYQTADVRSLWLAENTRLNTPPALDDPEADTDVWETRTIFAFDQPDENLPTALGAGTAESGGVNTLVFQPELDVHTALLDAGIDPDSTPSEFRALGVYVDITSDDKHYLVRSVSGQTVVVTVTHAPGANSDAFWADANIALTAGGEVCGLYQRGAAFASVDEKAEAAALTAETFGGADSVGALFCPRIVTPLGTVEYVVDGHFLVACLAGWMSYHPEVQGFTNMALRSVTRAYGTQDTFNARQMNRIAGGGAMIFFQPDPKQAVVVCRHQLTNDTTDDYRMQFSIRSQRDAGGWAFRALYRPLLGKNNVTASYLAYLMTKGQGCVKNLIARGSWMPGSRMLSLVQDPSAAKRTLCRVKCVPGMPHDEADTTIVL